MSFKLEHKNKNGSFKLKLNREVPVEEMEEIIQLANTLLPPSEIVSGTPTAAMGFNGYHAPVYGPQLPSTDSELDPRHQTHLGQFPKSEIKMGTYEEPDDGVRVKFVHFIQTNRIPTFKVIANATGISLIGSMNIVYGNYPCPKLTIETAQHIIEELSKLTPPVYAKIVAGTEDVAA